MKNTHLTKTRFSNLELSDSILICLKDAGFNLCTPIQDRALPLILRNKDIAGQAQTGTGKTAIIDSKEPNPLIGNKPTNSTKPNHNKKQRAIILAPTRELAIQIHKDALLLSKHLIYKNSLLNLQPHHKLTKILNSRIIEDSSDGLLTVRLTHRN